jgi:DNA-binding LacI/PurR family transcriptional regulator
MTALLDALEGRPVTGVELPVQLIARGSTAAPRQA